MSSTKQEVPQGDNRKRAFRTSKVRCYLADFRGTNTLDFSQSITRAVFLFKFYKFNNEYLRAVQYCNKYYPVYSPKRMVEIVRYHLKNNGIVNLGGKLLHSLEDDFEPYPFISTMSDNDLVRHPKIQEIFLNPDYIFDYESNK